MHEIELVAMRRELVAMRRKNAAARCAVALLLAAADNVTATPKDRGIQRLAAAALMAKFEAKVLAGE